ncbi:hypothetical protein BOTBODRAFT_443880 [Botryobasidium botryosum FD-172 SS1]|uniref:Uncharacterized protein n=1 Tax=Botryobasidium botryosum (strain FD-172 SS1) TaxID=930990 RepID=A0A067N742_BOTB1|nr:hypothetical protein BOTBODRAFT_443880 [Botryobasidium botryosum FD-172 SS1]
MRAQSWPRPLAYQPLNLLGLIHLQILPRQPHLLPLNVRQKLLSHRRVWKYIMIHLCSDTCSFHFGSASLALSFGQYLTSLTPFNSLANHITRSQF